MPHSLMTTRLSDYDYDLPDDFIALYPSSPRSDARLMYVPRYEKSFTHSIFRDITQYLKKGDVLVLNNTRVLSARLLGRRQMGGQVEVFLVRQIEAGVWEALIRPSSRVRKGTELIFEQNGTSLTIRILDDAEGQMTRRVATVEPDALERLEKVGHIPLPPYIRRPDEPGDRTHYQTVFAQNLGAVASPTAGLHFDEALLEKVKSLGVEIVFITLHVGYGTFMPITEEDLSKHSMFAETYEIGEETAEKINRALGEGRRIIACGTTSVRALESAVSAEGNVKAQKADTSLFIYPPFSFKVVSGLITNFHLPRSSLLTLVAAFLNDRPRLLEIYREAVRESYRFYSYGDAMLIL